MMSKDNKVDTLFYAEEILKCGFAYHLAVVTTQPLSDQFCKQL